jgi:hypothetical protein
MSLWWQVWGIGIVELAVFVGIGIVVLVKLRNAASATKYCQNNNDNKSSSINQISNHKKMRNNSKIIRKHTGQDSYRNCNQNTEYYNGKDIFPIPHSQNTVSKVGNTVNHNREEPRGEGS